MTVSSSPVAPSSIRNSGPRPFSSAVTTSADPSRVQRAAVGHRSQPGATGRGAPPASGTRTSSVRGATSGVETRSRSATTVRPSGLIRGAAYSWPSSSVRSRCSPVAVSTTSRPGRQVPWPCARYQPVTTEPPSGDTSNAVSSSARPGAGVRSRHGSVSPGVARSSRSSAGPRSWSQCRTG
ncbi:hypothetical protein [Pseudonocardia sp. ICBG601]|uniref:hypothetical protein n=1 Tax=Pseudonocardia sp. ICBG601 TaxID=2846759 RepID=UPI001CF6B3BD|nr:hypothetical protein [Pseudonocardia sp. ICBG601]